MPEAAPGVETITCTEAVGSLLWCGHTDGSISIRDPNSARDAAEIRHLRSHAGRDAPYPTCMLAVAACDSVWVGFNDGRLVVADAHSYEVLGSGNVHVGRVNMLLHFDDMIFSCSDDSFVHRYSADDVKPLRNLTLAGHTGAVQCIAAAGAVLASVGAEQSCRVWVGETGQEVMALSFPLSVDEPQDDVLDRLHGLCGKLSQLELSELSCHYQHLLPQILKVEGLSPQRARTRAAGDDRQRALAAQRRRLRQPPIAPSAASTRVASPGELSPGERGERIRQYDETRRETIASTSPRRATNSPPPIASAPPAPTPQTQSRTVVVSDTIAAAPAEPQARPPRTPKAARVQQRSRSSPPAPQDNRGEGSTHSAQGSPPKGRRIKTPRKPPLPDFPAARPQVRRSASTPASPQGAQEVYPPPSMPCAPPLRARRQPRRGPTDVWYLQLSNELRMVRRHFETWLLWRAGTRGGSPTRRSSGNSYSLSPVSEDPYGSGGVSPARRRTWRSRSRSGESPPTPRVCAIDGERRQAAQVMEGIVNAGLCTRYFAKWLAFKDPYKAELRRMQDAEAAGLSPVPPPGGGAEASGEERSKSGSQEGASASAEVSPKPLQETSPQGSPAPPAGLGEATPPGDDDYLCVDIPNQDPTQLCVVMDYDCLVSCGAGLPDFFAFCVRINVSLIVWLPVLSENILHLLREADAPTEAITHCIYRPASAVLTITNNTFHNTLFVQPSARPTPALPNTVCIDDAGIPRVCQLLPGLAKGIADRTAPVTKLLVDTLGREPKPVHYV